MDRLVAQLFRARNRYWAVAVVAATAFLESIADEVLEDDDRDRLDAGTSRIKKRSRAADKMRRKVAEGVFDPPETPEDVEDALHDLVGIKVLCKSPRDLRAFTEALERACTTPDASIRFAIPPIDYVTAPKDSGYRAYHAVIVVPVSTNHGDLAIKVEVQVKTRLQDAWGELTHEDMYRPGEALKADPVHEDYARRMADLLATVDDMADTLALELDSKTGAEPSIPVRADVDTEPEQTTIAHVTRTGPKYALAVGPDGRRGLIPAKAVRDLLGTSDRIRVSDHIDVGDRLAVVVDETPDALYYHPLSLPEH
ncbi:RelA/SpoT protein [Rhodococcus rhodnii]|uniref:RelA/SpoT protein n=1 Tax=Rhodococcus rhodnii TaxID=38312 RepID=A0A6P2CKU3_9NOCA|nr:RelA/SpoT protein [Rhodococcus rhodnii]